MKALFVSDIHFSDATRDEFMWELFPKLEKLIVDHDIDYLIVGGDLTKAKGGHSATLVNRITDGFASLAKHVEIRILFGNHDGLSSNDAFMRFFNHIPNIRFLTEITEETFAWTYPVIYLPHTRDPLTDWKDLDLKDKFVFAHLTVRGALAENSQELDGVVTSDFFDGARRVIAGDVHLPQQIGEVIYCGSPYQTSFCKPYEGGVLILNVEENTWERIPLNFLKRYVLNIETLADLELQLPNLNIGDQVKVRIHLKSHNVGDWNQIKTGVRELCKQANLDLHAIEILKHHEEVLPMAEARVNKSDFDSFCETQKISQDLKEIGAEILKESANAI